jgi:8-oxo-dGTP pyrophosphatase MutT (NUDIX family)
LPHFEYIELLKKELAKELPGKDFQLRMAPEIRIQRKTKASAKKAAVLILLYPDEQLFFTVFIKRTKYLGIHSGQISLPGGKMEKNDTDISATALREAEEEIGIKRNDVEILGYLSQLLIPVSNMLVFPVIGFIPYRPNFIKQPGEVDELIETSIDMFLHPEVIQKKNEKILFRKAVVPFYNINGNHIWGATAMIISEFGELLQRIKSDR